MGALELLSLNKDVVYKVELFCIMQGILLELEQNLLTILFHSLLWEVLVYIFKNMNYVGPIGWVLL